MPASTGIGLGPVSGQWCSMDLAAVIKPVDSIEYLRTTGKQHCAYDYGSAFSRATRAISPAGKTVFISGPLLSMFPGLQPISAMPQGR